MVFIPKPTYNHVCERATMTKEIIIYDRTLEARETLASLQVNTAAGTPYELTFVNNSAKSWNFCTYQTSPEQKSAPDLLSLAWFAKQVTNNGATAIFKWSVDYSLLWAETGQLVPGVLFESSQTVKASPTTFNNIGLSQISGAYYFNPATPQPPTDTFPQGTLGIQCDDKIPNNAVSVGIGMSGAGTFAYQAGPNLGFSFTPTPTYWVGCANKLQEGQVLTTTIFTQIAEIRFPVNMYKAKAELTSENKWTITYKN